MTRPEQPKPSEPKEKTLGELFEQMDKLKTDLFDAIEIITDEYKEKQLVSVLTYGSYHANRGYGMSAETYANMMGWNEETAQAYENAYRANMEQQREDERYKRLIGDLELLEDENFTNQ